MALIRLEFDVDSDVYPELHAVLSIIASSGSRGERVRQLAASGLVWERFRAQGQLPPESRVPVARSSAAEPAAVVPSGAASVAAKSKARSPKRRSTDAATPSDFVDLAIDAKTAISLDDALTARAPDRGRDKGPPRDLPVLVDVVDAGTASGWMDSSPGEPTDLAAPPFAVESTLRHDAADDVGEDGSIAQVAQASGKRSRLMRMKEKGLFKNG